MSLFPSRGGAIASVEDPDGVAEGSGASANVEADRDEIQPADDQRKHSGLLLAGLTLLVISPLIVALAVLRQPRWFPILDLAMTELRIRDVGTGNTPLIGLPGRIGVLGQDHGSHPGPLSFWVLAPVYRLLGASAWASEVSTVVLHTAAIGVALWLGRRRGGLLLVLAIGAAVATLARSYGAEVLTQPWNPYMPVIWWFVLLLAVWSVLCRDIIVLPVAVFAASLCAQTHAPYLGIVGGVAALALVGVADAYRRSAEPAERRKIVRWTLGSAALGVVLWTAPIVDQFTVDPGNISLLIEHFGNPPEAAVGFRRALRMVLLHLDVWRLFTEQGADAGSLSEASRAPTGSILPGVALLAAWAASVLVAWRLRHQALLRLHLTVAVALAAAGISISRIFGPLWYYLMLWAWGITTLLVVATVWTLGEFLARRSESAPNRSLVRPAGGVLLAVIVISTVVFGVDAASTEQPADDLSLTMAVITPDVIAAMSDGSTTGRGRDERYLVTWSDAIHIGSQGIALVNELERAGFDVGVLKPWSVPVARHRTRDPSEASSFVHLATGIHVETWRANPDATEIAFVDTRSPEEQEEFKRIRLEVIEELERAGVPEIIDLVDTNLFSAAIDTRVPVSAQDGMSRMLELGEPTAVFIGPAAMVD